MKIRARVAVLGLMLMWVVPVWAGQDGSPQENLERVRQRLEEIKERLDLTPEQIEQMRPVLIEEVQKLRALQEKYKGDDQSGRTRVRMARGLREIQNSADDKLRKILSKKQMEEMKKIREESREQLRDRARQK